MARKSRSSARRASIPANVPAKVPEAGGRPDGQRGYVLTPSKPHIQPAPPTEKPKK